MKQYYILSVPGSASMFFTTVIAKYLGEQPAVISSDGNCHDLGQGNWAGSDMVEMIGDYLHDVTYTKPLLYSHVPDIAKVRQRHPDLEVILIDYDEDDIELISRLRTVKAHHLAWNETEYEKLAGPDWPPYSPDNILTSSLIREELVQMQIPHTRAWLEQIDRSQIDSTVHFKTIFYGNLNQTVAELLQQPVRPDVQEFISQYQLTNQQLYR